MRATIYPVTSATNNEVNVKENKRLSVFQKKIEKFVIENNFPKNLVLEKHKNEQHRLKEELNKYSQKLSKLNKLINLVDSQIEVFNSENYKLIEKIRINT